MSTFAEVLAAQLRREPGRPLLTFYDHATDERVELSVTTYANWVAKASGLLSDVADLERGMTLRIDLPPHWLSPVFLGAAWTIGLRVTASDEADAVVLRPRGPRHVGGTCRRHPGAGLQPAPPRRAVRRPAACRRPRRRCGDLVAARRLRRLGPARPTTTARPTR